MRAAVIFALTLLIGCYGTLFVMDVHTLYETRNVLPEVLPEVRQVFAAHAAIRSMNHSALPDRYGPTRRIMDTDETICTFQPGRGTPKTLSDFYEPGLTAVSALTQRRDQ